MTKGMDDADQIYISKDQLQERKKSCPFSKTGMDWMVMKYDEERKMNPEEFT